MSLLTRASRLTSVRLAVVQQRGALVVLEQRRSNFIKTFADKCAAIVSFRPCASVRTQLLASPVLVG